MRSTLKAGTCNYISIIVDCHVGLALYPLVLQQPDKIAYSALLVMAYIGDLNFSLLHDHHYKEGKTDISKILHLY